MALEKNYSEDYEKHIKAGHSLETIAAAYRGGGLKVAVISLIFIIPGVVYFIFVAIPSFNKQGWGYEHPLLNYLIFIVGLLASIIASFTFVYYLMVFFFPKKWVLKDKKDYDDCVAGIKPWYKPQPVTYTSSGTSTSTGCSRGLNPPSSCLTCFSWWSCKATNKSSSPPPPPPGTPGSPW